MKDKKALKYFMFNNYIIILALVIMVLFLTQLVSYFIIDTFIFKGIKTDDINIEDIYSYPFETISTEVLNTYGGWYEIVDEKGEVIYVIGKKEDETYQYTIETLFNQINTFNNSSSLRYKNCSVSGPNGEKYIFLWKYPLKMVAFVDIFDIKVFGVVMITFSMLLLIALYLYSLYSARHINIPLKNIIQGIREMERQNYKMRLTFTAEKEIAEIRDAFNKMAEQLQKRTDMLLHLSHDLKTPITTVYGFAKLLHDNEINDEKEKIKYIKYIHDKSLYVSNLIKDLFELTKLDDSRFKLNMEEINISKWLRQIVIEVYPEIEEKELNLEVQIPEYKIELKIDKMMMKRVISNIINNSIKYNSKGTTVYVQCKRIDEKVVINIGDDGIGINPQIKNRIFDSFVRGEHNEDGTGLGMAISKRIVDKHDGEIKLIENDIIKTNFEIILPIN